MNSLLEWVRERPLDAAEEIERLRASNKDLLLAALGRHLPTLWPRAQYLRGRASRNNWSPRRH